MDNWTREQLSAARELILTLNRFGLVTPFGAFMIHGQLGELIMARMDSE